MIVAQNIPNEHHIARYCGSSRYEGDVVLPAAFKFRRPRESYLSVNWLEYFDMNTFDEALSRICEDKLEKGYTIRNTGRFAVLHTGFVRSISSSLYKTSQFLTVTHIPEIGDKSHSGIGGYEDEGMDLMVADLLAESVSSDMLKIPTIP